MKEEVSAEDHIKLKKKRAAFIAGTITFFIFTAWLFYFVNHTKKIIAHEDSTFALLEDLKENTKKPWEELKNMFSSFKEKFSSIASPSGAQSENTFNNLNN